VSEHQPEGIQLRSRTIGHLHVEDDTVIAVEHVYIPEGAVSCDDCGAPAHDPGMVGLVVSREDGEDDAGPLVTSVLMTAEDALVLANRLQRAASLILESAEDNPDIEREAARFAPAEGPAGGA